jgi:predicted metalloenzyme YecM
MNPLQQIIGNYEEFIKDIISEVKGSGFDLVDFVQLDVLCYQASSLEEYENKKASLNKIGALLSEVQMSGRPICTVRLRNPILTQDWRIDVVEVVAPKTNDDKLTGLEHIQFVLFDSLQTFMERYPTKQFDIRAVERGINPMITFKFEGGRKVKFHIVSLPAAIYLEQKLGLAVE